MTEQNHIKEEQFYDFLTLTPPSQNNNIPNSNSNYSQNFHGQQLSHQQINQINQLNQINQINQINQQNNQLSYTDLVSPTEPPPAPTTSLPPHFQIPDVISQQQQIQLQQLQRIQNDCLEIPTFNISVNQDMNQDLNDFYSTATRPAANMRNNNMSSNSSNNSNLNLNTEVFYDNNISNLLSPKNFEINRSHSNSFYSDYSSNLNSPYLDASSHFSFDDNEIMSQHSNVNDNLSPLVQNMMPMMHQNESNLDLNFDINLNDINFNNFSNLNTADSISNVDLAAINQNILNQHLNQQHQLHDLQLNHQEPTNKFFTSSNSESNSILDMKDLKFLDSKLNKLTEGNLQTNNILNHPSPVTISIQEAPEAVAAKTPSLFSNSTHSSRHNSPNRSRANTNEMKNFGNTLSPNDNYLPSGNNNNNNSGDDLLKPEEFNNIRSGRARSHSNKSQSRSKSTDSRKSNTSTSREKMLELASPNQSNKRTQKHPSVYACHLCDKRFTRPYNLKSHLRTHTDERPFICTVCSKAFARQHDRKRHEDLHTGEKKFQCKGQLKNGTPYGCGRKFARADALRRHFQTEAGKECIKLLIEEAERDGSKFDNFDNFSKYENNDDDLENKTESLGVGYNIPQVAISPPDSKFENGNSIYDQIDGK